jgi:hypothetical protein
MSEGKVTRALASLEFHQLLVRYAVKHGGEIQTHNHVGQWCDRYQKIAMTRV